MSPDVLHIHRRACGRPGVISLRSSHFPLQALLPGQDFSFLWQVHRGNGYTESSRSIVGGRVEGVCVHLCCMPFSPSVASCWFSEF